MALANMFCHQKLPEQMYFFSRMSATLHWEASKTLCTPEVVLRSSVMGKGSWQIMFLKITWPRITCTAASTSAR